jgi:surface polysaccharide O-acyltransferase-like enzyme
MPSLKAAGRRDVGADLIRLLALSFVLGVHFYTHCDIYNAAYSAPASFAVVILRTALTPALSLFIMLNGYFQRRKTVSASYYLGILKLLELYIICAVVELIYRHFFFGEELSARSFFGAIVNFTASDYSWYILLYLGLFLLIPFLNLMYNSISCRGHKRILIFSLFVLSALPFSALNAFVNLCPYWWQRIWPLMFYFMGAYFGEYHPHVGAKKALVWFFSALLIFSAFNFFVYSDASPVSVNYAQAFLYSHESLQNAVLTPLLFLLITNLDFSNCPQSLSSALATVSKYSYGVFLFSSMTDSFIYQWLCILIADNRLRILLFLPGIIISGSLALLLTWLADKLVNLIDSFIRPLAAHFFSWLYHILAPDAVE